MPSMSLRLGNTLYQCCRTYYHSFSTRMTRSQTAQYLLIKYMEEPRVYSVLEVRELREPMKYSLTLTVPDKLQGQLCAFAKEHQLTLSEVIRMAIYQELIIHGNQ